MTRRSPRTLRKTASKKALRRANRRVTIVGQAYVSMLRRRRMSHRTNTATFVGDIFGEDIHVKCVQSLPGIQHKSGVKQVDRLLSNNGLNVDELERHWVRYVVVSLPELTVAMDRTDFDDDDHTTLCVYLVTRAGQALPLVWKTAKTSALKDNQTPLETETLERLIDWAPEGTKLTVLADRGFGKSELYECCALLGLDYVIRFRQDILVTDADGNRAAAAEYTLPNMRPRMVLSPTVMEEKAPRACGSRDEGEAHEGALVHRKLIGQKDRYRGRGEICS